MYTEYMFIPSGLSEMPVAHADRIRMRHALTRQIRAALRAGKSRGDYHHSIYSIYISILSDKPKDRRDRDMLFRTLPIPSGLASKYLSLDHACRVRPAEERSLGAFPTLCYTCLASLQLLQLRTIDCFVSALGQAIACFFPPDYKLFFLVPPLPFS